MVVAGKVQKANKWHSNRMLDFAARHNINPIIQEFPMTIEGIEEAFETMENGSLRYRAVLKN